MQAGMEYAQKDSVLPEELQKGLRISHSSIQSNNLCNGGAKIWVTSATECVLHFSKQLMETLLRP